MALKLAILQYRRGNQYLSPPDARSPINQFLFSFYGLETVIDYSIPTYVSEVYYISLSPNVDTPYFVRPAPRFRIALGVNCPLD